MISPYSINRPTAPSPSLLRRLEVVLLDCLITALDIVQRPRLAGRARRAWRTFNRLSAARQIAFLAGLALIFFCLGLLKGAF